MPWDGYVLVGMVVGAPFLLFFLLADRKACAHGEGGEGSGERERGLGGPLKGDMPGKNVWKRKKVFQALLKA